MTFFQQLCSCLGPGGPVFGHQAASVAALARAGVLKLRPMGRIRPPRVLNWAPAIDRTTPTPPRPPLGVEGGNQAAADDCLPLHPRAGPLVKKFEDPWSRQPVPTLLCHQFIPNNQHLLMDDWVQKQYILLSELSHEQFH